MKFDQVLIKNESSRNITNASAIDPKVRLEIDQMLITIESSRNITNASTTDPKARLQIDCLCVQLQIDQMSIKIESSRNSPQRPQIIYINNKYRPKVRLQMATSICVSDF